MVELVPCLDNGSPVVGKRGTDDGRVLGQTSIRGPGEQGCGSGGAGGQQGGQQGGYSHDPVATARALW